MIAWVPVLAAALQAESRPAPTSRSSSEPGIVLTEVDPRAAGVDFVKRMGAAGEKFVVETMGSGLALFDADGDGDVDLYLLQGRPMPGCDPFDGRSRYYSNDGSMHFTDATDASGLGDAGYAMGAAVADIDNDGDLDVYVSAYGRGHLFVNRGNAVFDDRTEASGLTAEGFLSSCAFGDFDADGLVDLYICNYLDYGEVQKNPYCGKHVPGGRAYCSPHAFSGAPDFLYRNRGRGRFEDVSKSTGVARAGRFDGKGLGVVLSDLDLDGDLEIAVANDSCANFLYRNDGGMRFEEAAAVAGIAFAEDGHERAGMGIDAVDVSGNGLPDILITNLSAEPNSFFKNLGGLQFEDASGISGLGPPAVPFVGFGCALVDFDADLDPDALVVNGHILDNALLFDDASPYAQRPLLFENGGAGRFSRVTARSGFLSEARVLRGLAIGDLDGDGDPDAVATPSEGAPILLRNDSKPAHHRLVLRLEGAPSNRSAIGARLQWSVAGRRHVTEVRTGFSYLSTSALPLSLSLAQKVEATDVEVRWPSGKISRVPKLAGDRVWLWKEGEAPRDLGPLARQR